jgi:uncharacterized membrane protein|tara:strand:- start:8558 stop:9115 length:558 start_codon:yes stop_codon:yes gene_type:complete
MTMLVIGMVLFFGTHLIPNIAGIKAGLVSNFGEKLYLLAYTVLSLIGITLMFMGRSRADFELLWMAPGWLQIVTMIIMFASLYCLLAMFMQTNLKKWLHHPMLTFMLLFGVGHMVSNGDVAALLFFGSLAIFSLFKIIRLSKRKPAAGFPAISIGKDFIILATTFVVYIGVIYIHPYLAGGAKVL